MEDICITDLFRYINRDLPVVNLRGEILFQAWRDIFQDNRFTLISSSRDINCYISETNIIQTFRESVFSQEKILYSFNGENVLNSSHW